MRSADVKYGIGMRRWWSCSLRTFRRIVTGSEKGQPEFAACRVAKDDPLIVTPPPAFASGMMVSMSDERFTTHGNFYVLAPSPVALAEGYLDQPDSLRRALHYRDKIAQSIVDRELGATITGLMRTKGEANELAFDLLNEGLGWARRQTSH